jgi:hypothetical protein
MSIWVLAIFGVVVVAAALLGFRAWRRSSAHADGPEDSTPHPAIQWGVRICAPAGRPACPQVRAIDGKEFTLSEKPQLPLPDCPFPHQCECTYLKLFDRRHADRRDRHDRRAKGQRFEPDKTPRRKGRDRRKKSDIDWA